MPVRNYVTSVEHATNQEYVHRVNTANGWFDQPVTFLECMATLMTEVVEVADSVHVGPALAGNKADPHMASELADCYIRLVDTSSRFGADLSVVIDLYRHAYTKRASWSFDQVCMQLMRRIRDMTEAYRVEGVNSEGGVGSETRKMIALFYLQLSDTCDDFNIDLLSAFSLKMAVNEKREYRHGHKHA